MAIMYKIRTIILMSILLLLFYSYFTYMANNYYKIVSGGTLFIHHS